jgi:hypothetical protein
MTIIQETGKPVAVWPADPKRVCAIADCVTVLSMYNGTAYCWVHELPHFRHVAVQRRAPNR